MAGNTATLTVKILTDASKATKGTQEAASGYQKFGSSLDKMVPAALGVTAAIVGVGAVAVQSASRTEQAMGALDSVFGENSDTVKAWAAGAADAVGLSESAYAELASGIGAQLNNLGLGADEALAGTKSLITVGADLAATFGGSTQQAVEALGSALRGEADPAEKYGLSLSQTAVNARLAEKGMGDLTGEAKTAAKTQAILELATEQAGGALGQFARESDTAAGSAERANANFEDAKSALGTALLPVVAKVTSKLAELAKWVKENSTLVTVIVGVIGAFAAVIITLSVAMKVATAVQWALNAAMAANPVGLVVIAIIAVIAVIVLLWTKSEAFRNFFIGLWAGIVAAVSAAWNWISDAASATFAVIVGIWNGIAAVAGAVWKWITDAVSGAFNFIMAIGRAYFSFYAAIFTAIGNTAKAVWNAIVAAISAAWNWILNLGRNALNFYAAIWQGILNSARNAWSAIRGVVNGVLSWIIGAARGVGNFVAGVWNGILSSGRSVWDSLANIVRGAMDAMMGPIRAVQDAFNGIISAVQDVIGWISRIKIPDLSALNPFKASAPQAFATGGGVGVSSFAAGVGLSSPSLGATASTRSGGITINLNGGLDSADTIARRIQQLLTARDRRQGGVVINRRVP